jgi:hypothetical protein
MLGTISLVLMKSTFTVMKKGDCIAISPPSSYPRSTMGWPIPRTYF